MYIGFIAWEHALRSAVSRLLERLRQEQARYAAPRICGIRVISGLFRRAKNTDGDRPGAHGVNSLSG